MDIHSNILAIVGIVEKICLGKLFVVLVGSHFQLIIFILHTCLPILDVANKICYKLRYLKAEKIIAV